MTGSARLAGIESLGTLNWGSHCCQFYRTKQDLFDILIPYFAAGLQNEELCLWITSDALSPEEAKRALAAKVPGLNAYIDRGQMEIWDYRDWYLAGGSFDAGRVSAQWMEKEDDAIRSGYAGLRAAGDTAWLETKNWADFVAYEAEVNRSFREHRMLGMCTYDMNRCGADGVLEVLHNHQFALARHAGEWQWIEGANLEIAREELRARDDFLAMLSHELRNPLAPIQSAAHLLRTRGQQDERLRWAAEVIDRQVRHLMRLVDDLLDVSRIIHGGVEIRRDILDIRTVIADAVEISRPLIDQRKQRLSMRVESRLTLTGDAQRLTQVLTNLLNNAAKYTPDSGAIELYAHRQDDQVVIKVTDNGAGIEPDLIPDIFEPFRQGQRSLDRAHGGLGIGLTLVKTVVEMHGGSVHASSEGPGKGSTFTVRLPRLATAAPASG